MLLFLYTLPLYSVNILLFDFVTLNVKVFLCVSALLWTVPGHAQSYQKEKVCPNDKDAQV